MVGTGSWRVIKLGPVEQRGPTGTPREDRG